MKTHFNDSNFLILQSLMLNIFKLLKNAIRSCKMHIRMNKKNEKYSKHERTYKNTHTGKVLTSIID